MPIQTFHVQYTLEIFIRLPDMRFCFLLFCQMQLSGLACLAFAFYERGKGHHWGDAKNHFTFVTMGWRIFSFQNRFLPESSFCANTRNVLLCDTGLHFMTGSKLEGGLGFLGSLCLLFLRPLRFSLLEPRRRRRFASPRPRHFQCSFDKLPCFLQSSCT